MEYKFGLSTQLIKQISTSRNEKPIYLDLRLQAYRALQNMSIPTWSELDLSKMDLKQFCYFTNKNPQHALQLSKQLNLKQDGTNDFVLDSFSFINSINQELKSLGIIFCSLSYAMEHHQELLLKHLHSVVPIGDNYFSTLNAAVFSDGTFIYIPPNVHCPLVLSSYFRTETEYIGQFERTLIIADENSYVEYSEGCTAQAYSESRQLHCAVVELIAYDKASIVYSTLQNWHAGHGTRGGVYNLVTKRGLAYLGSKIAWHQVELGACATWKYPSVILKGDNSIGEFYSLAFTKHAQQAETGTKMLHIGKHTRSISHSTSVSYGQSKNIYRALVHIGPQACHSSSWSKCDAVIYDQSQSYTMPTFQLQNSDSHVEHEAVTWSLRQPQLNYLLLRGMCEQEAIKMITLAQSSTIMQYLNPELKLETINSITNFLQN